jgi:hypothetical protein
VLVHVVFAIINAALETKMPSFSIFFRKMLNSVPGAMVNNTKIVKYFWK